MVRTLVAHIERVTKSKVGLNHPIVPWLVRHAGYLISRCVVRSNDKAAMPTMNGRKSNVPLLPICETVLYKLPKPDDTSGDSHGRFEECVWLGVTIRPGEHLVTAPSGV